MSMARIPTTWVLTICVFAKMLVLVGGTGSQHFDFDVALQHLQAEYDVKLQQCTDKVDRLADEVRGQLLEQEKQFAAKLEATCERTCETPRNQRQTIIYPTQQTVAFFAQLASDLFGIRDNQTIVFDLVQTNIGHGYDETSGVFTAPGTGVYVFLWTSTNYNIFSYLQSELMVNGIIKGRQWSDSGTDNDVSSATGSAVLNLKSGDSVWIRTNTAHLGDTLKGELMSSFSGWLLK